MEVLFMGRMSKKIKYNYKNLNIKLSMRFRCPNCNFSKDIPREVFKRTTEEEFHNTNIFNCPHCNIRMNPYQILADY